MVCRTLLRWPAPQACIKSNRSQRNRSTTSHKNPLKTYTKTTFSLSNMNRKQETKKRVSIRPTNKTKRNVLIATWNKKNRLAIKRVDKASNKKQSRVLMLICDAPRWFKLSSRKIPTVSQTAQLRALVMQD